MPSQPTRSTSSSSDASSAPAEIFGSTVPRLWTPPLRELTPETSYGFDVIWFADHVLGTPLDPWQQWAAIHLGELLPDGRPRFRTVVILVARQNGKTLLALVLVLYWMFVEYQALTLLTSTDRSYAKRFWQRLCEWAQENPWLAEHLGRGAVRLTISEEALTTLDGAELIFAANNGRAGRSTTLHRWVCDELREHRTDAAWSSATNAQNAVPDAQTVCISNQGDDSALVLDMLRGPAVEFIETGEGDPRLGLFEWSGPPGVDPDDVSALAAANPNLNRPGHGPDLDALLGAARRAKRAGGQELASFRTEVLCQRVALLDPAIDPDLWAAARATVPDLAHHRDRVALCLDVSLDGSHASLVAAAELDGRIYLDVVAAWQGFGCTKQLRADLPGIVERVRPRVLGWLPGGPAAAVAADLAPRRGWPPRRVVVEEIRADTAAACMALPELVKAGEIAHPDDPMLNAHVAAAQRLRTGDRFVYTRSGTGPVDGAYAAAGAVHLARTLPPPPPPLVAL